MKKALCLSAFSFFFLCISAQQTLLVTDKEQLFTNEEISRINNLLQDYYKKTGNLIVVCTDSLDISAKAYKDSLIGLYTGNQPIKPYAVFLLLSRKNSAIRLESNELSNDSLGKKDAIELAKMNTESNQSADAIEDAREKFEAFMKIVSYGIPALKEKKREEGVTIICKKAMEFLDGLPKKQMNK